MRKQLLLITIIVVIAACLAAVLLLPRGGKGGGGKEEGVANRETMISLIYETIPVLKGKEPSIKVTVEGLTEGSRIPRRYTCDAVRPEPPIIHWTSVEGARSYVVIVFDPDAPIGTFYHLLAYDGSITKWPNLEYKLGKNSAGQATWYPVCPPHGHGTHRYIFVVIALDTETGLQSGATINQLLKAIKGHIIAYGFTWGVYSR